MMIEITCVFNYKVITYRYLNLQRCDTAHCTHYKMAILVMYKISLNCIGKLEKITIEYPKMSKKQINFDYL